MKNSNQTIDFLSSTRASFLLFINIVYVNLIFLIIDGKFLGESALRLAFYTPLIMEGELIRLITWPLIHSGWYDLLIPTILSFYLTGKYLERVIGSHRFIIALTVNLIISSLLFLIVQIFIIDSVNNYYFSINVLTLSFFGQLIFIFVQRPDYYSGMDSRNLIFLLAFFFITYLLRLNNFFSINLILLIPIGILTGYLTSFMLFPKETLKDDLEFYPVEKDTENHFLFCPYCGARVGMEEYCNECHEKIPTTPSIELPPKQNFNKEYSNITLYILLSFLLWPIIWGGLAVWRSLDLRKKSSKTGNIALIIVGISLLVNLYLISIFL